MVEMIKSGDANGILVWKPNRLARNAKENGIIRQLLHEGKIKSIQTQGREHKPGDNALILSVESGMATQYSRSLGDDVKRGFRDKLEKGWKPGIAPQGYLNSKTEARGDNYIKKDLERFHVIRKAWDLMLTGDYTVSEIRDIMNDEWGYRTRKMKSRGGNPISRSSLYELFKKPFYMGVFRHKGEWYDGAHKPMITTREFDKVQHLLGDRGTRRPNQYNYAYNTEITCGECGGTVSATYKEKILSDGTLASYIYYYCVNAQKTDECSHTTYTNVSRIEDQIEEAIDSCIMDSDIKDWAVDMLPDKEEYKQKKQDSIKNQ